MSKTQPYHRAYIMTVVFSSKNDVSFSIHLVNEFRSHNLPEIWSIDQQSKHDDGMGNGSFRRVGNKFFFLVFVSMVSFSSN